MSREPSTLSDVATQRPDAHRTGDEPVRAYLRPMKAKQETETVTLLSRVANRKIKVLLDKRNLTFAVDRFRLFQIEARAERVPDSVLDALPWYGKGVDPLAAPTPESRGLGLIRETA